MTTDVLIPTYDRPGWLQESVASVRAQTDPDVQVIIGHDQAGRGPFETFERMLPLARGKFVWLFSDDDQAHPRFLERMTMLLEYTGAEYGRCAYWRWDGNGHEERAEGDNLNAFLFRRSLLDRVRSLYGSVFPKGMRQYADAVLFFRLDRMEVPIVTSPEPLIRYRIHDGQMTRQLSFRAILDNIHAKNLMDGAEPMQIARQFGWLLRNKVPL